MSPELERLRSALADRYGVERELGRGGMATVYLAEDLRHHRHVAIKVLKPELSAALGPERFLREIKISAGLTHPNILTLIDSGEADGLAYYVMPYVAGESLRQRLNREEQLPLADALQITREVADAIGYAHTLGIVHRDIKPENILLEAGHAVVTDFGIAQAVSVAGGEGLTATGFGVGTPAYMSPEQDGSGRHPDIRSDIYSLACVLYEMLAGYPPFTGVNPAAVLARKRVDPVPSLRVVREAVSHATEAVVIRCLSRVPADRPATMREFVEALTESTQVPTDGGPTGSLSPSAMSREEEARRARRRRLLLVGATLAIGGVLLSLLALWDRGGGAPGMGKTSVAASPSLEDTARVRVGVLLPEAREGTDQARERARLIQHLLSSELSRFRGLAVVDPLSLSDRLEAAAAPSGADPIAALRDLGIRFVIRTNLTTLARGVEVGYVLIDTRHGDVVQAGSFTNSDETDLPSQIQQAGGRLSDALEIASDGITRKLDMEPWVLRGGARVAAVRSFLQGTDYAYRGLPGGGEHFERAIRQDPDFIAPRVWLVSGLVGVGDTAAARVHVKALQSLEPGATPFEQALIGWAEAVLEGDWEAKVGHLRVALGYSPRNNVLLYNLGASLLAMGRPGEALVPVREAVESGWRFAPLYDLWAVLAIEANELEGLRETLEAARNITPPSPYFPALLEALALYDSDSSAAERYADAFRAELGGPQLAVVTREMVPVYLTLGRRARGRGETEVAMRLFQHAVDADPQDPTTHLELARVLAEAGDRQAGLLHYRAVGTSESEAPDVIYVRGEVAALLGLTGDSRTYFTRYLNLAPSGPDAAKARERLRSLEGPSGPR